MTSLDISYIFTWYLSLFFLGLISLPSTVLFFNKFRDKGYALSKTISLTLVTFTVFVLSSFRFISFSQASLFWIMVTIFGLNYFVLLKKYSSPKAFIKIVKQHLPIFITEEIVFLAVLFFWSYIRAFRPDIDNLEKPMDWGFVNSALKSQYLPPVDMWFSGKFINYYYFGHLIHAVITKISQIPSYITYNLSMATVLALTFSQSLSLAFNLINAIKPKISLIKIFLFALTSAFLVTFGGNLHHVYKIAKLDIQANNGLSLKWPDIKKAAQSYWYPDATRFIGYDPDIDDKTIHEFPMYSFVVADLHGHMNNIPQFILFLSFIFAISLNPSLSLINWPQVLGSGFLLSISYMTNAWDFAIFTFLVNVTRHKNIFYAILKTFVNGILTIAAWFIFTLPFSQNFEPMMEGLKISDSHSPFWQLLILYGGFWLISFPFVYFLKFKKSKLSDIPLCHLFVLSLIITATILIICPEIFYIKDIYIYSHRRANTMFKLVYAAFMMYGLSASYILFNFSQVSNKLIKNLYKVIFFLVFVIHVSYSYFAIKSNYGNLKSYQGLDGMLWYQLRYPDNFKAITWLNNNINGQPTVLEAAGDSYTDFNMVSAATGFPTIEGWIVHEWLWRGGYDQPAKRQQDVDAIYSSTDQKTIRSLVQDYGVDYIFIGDKEVEKYPSLNEDNIAAIADLVFQSGATKIYKIKK